MKILVADDDASTAERIRKVLVEGGHADTCAVSRVESLRKLVGYDVAIIDIVWPTNARPAGEPSEYFGFRALNHLRQCDPACRVILMSKHLFDLDQLVAIQHADGYFRSDAPDGQVLGVLGKILAPEGSASPSPSGEVPAFVFRRYEDRMDIHMPVVRDADVHAYLTIIEHALLDGRADLFGLRQRVYEDALEHVRQMKAESEESKQQGGRWKKRLEALYTMLSGCKNLVEVVEAIRRLVGLQ